jgi:hypothetical protein
MKIKNPKFFRASCLALVFLSAGLPPSLLADVATAKLVAGSKLISLTIGTTTYQNVLIRSISARSAMITYDGGMKSILLHDLSPELQQRFGYSPEAEQAQEVAAKASQAAAEKQQQARLVALRKTRQIQASRSQGESKIDQLLSLFGQPPEISKVVDLRPKFSELGLWVKSQGYRPSCSVFAIVSALEFQSAEINGTAERFSEEYLIWATRKTLNRAPLQQAAADGNSEDLRQRDAGFALQEVVTALRTYGIPPRDTVPNRFAGAVNEPPAEIVDQAKNSRRVAVHHVPGRDGPTLIANIIQALNAGVPVPVGMRWAIGQTWRTGFLNEQPAFEDRGHAVTLVGYKSETGRIEDTVFTFKNSWGTEWGVDGYGFATYKFLSKNLHTAVVLEVSAK